MYSKDEIENYDLMSPLWAGVGNPILVPGVNEDFFWSQFLTASKYGRVFKKMRDSEHNRGVLLELARDRSLEYSVSNLTAILRDLVLTESPLLEDPNPELEPVATGPTQEEQWLAWINDPNTSMRQVDSLRRTDPAFSAFYSKMSAAQRTTEVGDAAVNLNANRTVKGTSDAAVQAFATFYRRASTDDIRKKLSPGLNPDGPAAAVAQQKLFEAAIAAGLI
jgi:hypothetical protein